MNKLFTLVIFSIIGISLSAFARPDRRYGSAGCGLGNIVFGKKDNQVLASTTNDSSGTQTFGMTSGTSNCTDEEPTARKKQARAFIQLNQETLANDVARGNGQSLETLCEILGVQDTDGFGQKLQTHYGEIFAKNATPESVEEKISSLL